MDNRDQLLTLLREHAHKRGTFTLSSGKKSDFYIDVRRVALSAQGHQLLGRLLLAAIDKPINAVAGVELGGCPLASAVSLTSVHDSSASLAWPDSEAIPAIYVRKTPKDHGTGNLIEQPFDLPQARGAKVVLVEDVITSGGSSVRAVKALTDAGFYVSQVIVVVDRQEGGVEILQKVVPNVTALFTRTDFLS